MSTSPPLAAVTGHTPDITATRNRALRAAAQEMETAFLSEMMKSAGLGKARESFGGGAGEEQFGSFLRHAQAENMVKAGGIGLAEHLFDALKARSDGQ